MADYDLVQVSELTATETPANADVLPIQQGTELKKITYANLKSKVVSDEANARQNADNLKLNKPTGGNGTAGQMLLTNGDGTTQWASPDDTLAMTGKAADAKATGDAIKAVDANLAALYSTSATYAVGDYCTKDGQLYRCTTAISTAEAWTAAHWSAVALGDDTRDLKSFFSYLDGFTSYGFSRGNNNLITVTISNVPTGAMFHLNNPDLLFRLKDSDTVVKAFSANDYTTTESYASLLCDVRNAGSSYISDDVFNAARIYVSTDKGILSKRIKDLEDDVASNTADIAENELDIIAIQDSIEKEFSMASIIQTAYQGGITGAAAGYSIDNIQASVSNTRVRSFNTTDNPKNILISSNTVVKLKCKSGYKFAYQVYNASTGIALDTFAFTTDPVTIKKTVAIYLVVTLAKANDANISTSEISNLDVYFSNDIKEAVGNLQENVGSEIEVPFTFAITEKIYKSKGQYVTEAKPQVYFNTASTGVSVFISENGNDSNDGLTVNTPKKTIESCLTVSNIQTIIFLSGTYTAGTNFTAGLTITATINFVGAGTVIINNGDGNPIKFTNNVYCENITFKGGNNTVISQQSSGTKVSVFYRCKFAEAYRSNGLSIMGGLAYIFECEAFGNAYDGFNYHANNSVVTNTLEVNCKAYNNGQYNLVGADGQSSNATTSHDDCPIVRLNGEYYACHGGIVADKDCDSANYGCIAGISTITDEANYPDRMSNYWCSYGNMWLYDCISYGSKYDTAVVNGGTIVADVTYPSNYPS